MELGVSGTRIFLPKKVVEASLGWCKEEKENAWRSGGSERIEKVKTNVITNHSSNSVRTDRKGRV